MSGAPAGFWRRYVAWTLDAVVVGVPVLLLAAPGLRPAWQACVSASAQVSATLSRLLLDGLESGAAPAALAARWLADPVLEQATTALQDAVGALVLPPLIGFIALAFVYAIVFERSAWQATPGKRALGLVVCDAAGRRLPAGHVLLRFMAGGLSWLTLNLGHALAALPPRHLALHDRVSGTRVCRREGAAPLPAWARAWIALHVLLLVAANAWLLRAVAGAVARAAGG